MAYRPSNRHQDEIQGHPGMGGSRFFVQPISQPTAPARGRRGTTLAKARGRGRGTTLAKTTGRRGGRPIRGGVTTRGACPPGTVACPDTETEEGFIFCAWSGQDCPAKI